MAKYIGDAALDAGLAYVSSNCEHMHLLSAEPAGWADIATYTLGNVAMSSGDFTAGDYGAGGRQILVASKVIAGTAAGNCTYLALVDTTGTTILAYGDTTLAVVGVGVNITVPSWILYLGEAV